MCGIVGIVGKSDVAQRLYDGTLIEARPEAIAACENGETDGCFAVAITELIIAVETLSQALYRHGATTPGTPVAAMLLGIETDAASSPTNPDPEPLNPLIVVNQTLPIPVVVLEKALNRIPHRKTVPELH